MKLSGYKRTKIAPGVTRFERKVGRAGDQGHYDTDLPWICWWFLSTDRETRFTGRSRVLMECAVCGKREKFRFPIPRFGPIPDRGEHPVRTRFKLAHLHRDRPNPMAWAKPLLNPAAHRKGIDLELLAMRLEADLRGPTREEPMASETQSRVLDGMDIVGKADNVTSYCLRCAPQRLASEHFDLHRFEAKWDRVRCDSCDMRLDSVEARRV